MTSVFLPLKTNTGEDFATDYNACGVSSRVVLSLWAFLKFSFS